MVSRVSGVSAAGLRERRSNDYFKRREEGLPALAVLEKASSASLIPVLHFMKVSSYKRSV